MDRASEGRGHCGRRNQQGWGEEGGQAGCKPSSLPLGCASSCAPGSCRCCPCSAPTTHRDGAGHRVLSGCWLRLSQEVFVSTHLLESCSLVQK